ncbi:unnamed protein product [Adineta steineri]|uniref:Uncharacterized protein n=1 Tax=Adineta steineri TaxID=433720 RepID=A0A818N012_9BILA|nr:unnamed protein product [Adineta steineri]CAF3597123.1 unnamed protein product [Adineta steineri]
MKQSTVGVFLVLFIFIVCNSMFVDARGCWGSGWGGCNDGGCNSAGGYCQNFGRPPNNDCRCVGIRSRHPPRRPFGRPG